MARKGRSGEQIAFTSQQVEDEVKAAVLCCKEGVGKIRTWSSGAWTMGPRGGDSRAYHTP